MTWTLPAFPNNSSAPVFYTFCFIKFIHLYFHVPFLCIFPVLSHLGKPFPGHFCIFKSILKYMAPCKSPPWIHPWSALPKLCCCCFYELITLVLVLYLCGTMNSESRARVMFEAICVLIPEYLTPETMYNRKLQMHSCKRFEWMNLAFKCTIVNCWCTNI